MGSFDHLTPANGPQSHSAADMLGAITEDLQRLQQNLSSQLSEDIQQLQTRRSKLMADIEALESDHEQLQAQIQDLKQNHEAVLSQQQLAQQQLWAKRLAQALATHLQARLSEPPANIAYGQSIDGIPQTNQALAALDQSLNTLLHSLQQDLNSYQSSLSQQISRMHSMEKQGEVILEALVNRLSQQLQTQMVQPKVAAAQNGHGRIGLPEFHSSTETPPFPNTSQGRLGRERESHLERSPIPKTAPTVPPSSLQKGLLLVSFSTLALSIHNVLVSVIGSGGQILGKFSVSSIFPLNIPNSLMLLWLRMVVVLPLLALVAGQVYPNIWSDIRQFFRGEDRRPALQVIASGGFLFLSQVLIYKAISDIGPAIAVTLLFVYPLIKSPLDWFLFGERPTPLHLVVMFAISMGIVFAALPQVSASLDVAASSISAWGVGAALLSSGAFALYLISMQLSSRRLHPVPLSFLQFSTVFMLTSTLLIAGSVVGIEPSQPASPWGVYLAGLMLGGLTVIGYVFNNVASQVLGAAQASIVATSGPIMTAMLASIIIPGEKSALHFIQWVGIALVTLGGLSLSLERLKRQRRQPQARP